MADRKISDLTALTTPATGDLIPIVDISEAAAADKNKSITVGELLRGAPDGTAAAPGIAFESDGGNGIFLAGTDQVGVATGGVERVEFGASEVVFNDGGADYDFRIEGDTNTALFFVDASTDRVGIGTTSPVGRLSVETASATDPGTVVTAGWDSSYVLIGDSDNTNGANLGLGFRTGGITSGFGTQIVSLDPNADWYPINYHGNLHVWYGGGTERARIDTSGRLLVGTSTARTNFYNTTYSSQFQVEGDSSATAQISLTSTFNGVNGPNLIFGKHRSGSVGGNTIVAANDQLGVLAFMGSDGSEQVTGASIACQVDGTPGANDMPGRLVFSTTADGASSPTERMRINGGGEVTTFCGANSWSYLAYNGNTAGTSHRLFGGYHSATAVYNGTESIRITTNGNILNTNNSYGSLSDIKLKENIVDASSQWNDLKAIQVRNYNFKEETGQQTHTQLGVIAQEIELVSPGLVSEAPDTDAEGNDLGTVTKSVNYSVLYMKAVKALQEAMERIETLEANNVSLEARLAALEAN